MSALHAVKLVDSSFAYQWFERWAVVKREADDPTSWGVVAWATSRDEARKIIGDIYRRERDRGEIR